MRSSDVNSFLMQSSLGILQNNSNELVLLNCGVLSPHKNKQDRNLFSCLVLYISFAIIQYGHLCDRQAGTMAAFILEDVLSRPDA